MHIATKQTHSLQKQQPVVNNPFPSKTKTVALALAALFFIGLSVYGYSTASNGSLLNLITSSSLLALGAGTTIGLAYYIFKGKKFTHATMMTALVAIAVLALSATGLNAAHILHLAKGFEIDFSIVALGCLAKVTKLLVDDIKEQKIRAKLFEQDEEGNTALHRAAIQKARYAIEDIITEARSIGCEDELLQVKNKQGLACQDNPFVQKTKKIMALMVQDEKGNTGLHRAKFGKKWADYQRIVEEASSLGCWIELSNILNFEGETALIDSSGR